MDTVPRLGVVIRQFSALGAQDRRRPVNGGSREQQRIRQPMRARASEALTDAEQRFERGLSVRRLALGRQSGQARERGLGFASTETPISLPPLEVHAEAEVTVVGDAENGITGKVAADAREHPLAGRAEGPRKSPPDGPVDRIGHQVTQAAQGVRRGHRHLRLLPQCQRQELVSKSPRVVDLFDHAMECEEDDVCVGARLHR